MGLCAYELGRTPGYCRVGNFSFYGGRQRGFISRSVGMDFATILV